MCKTLDKHKYVCYIVRTYIKENLMENENNENQCCKNCRYFERYYTKGLIKFMAIKLGWCCVKSEAVDINDKCEKFFKAFVGYKRRGKKALERSINKILLDIAAIREGIETNGRDE